MGVCYIRASVRDVSVAMAGSLLRNFISCFQAQPLQLGRPDTDLLSFVSVLHGERLPWAIFCSYNHAFVPRILYTCWHRLCRSTVETEKQLGVCRCYNLRVHSRPRTIGSLRHSIRSPHAEEGRSPGSSGKSPKGDRPGAGYHWRLALRSLFLHCHARY